MNSKLSNGEKLVIKIIALILVISMVIGVCYLLVSLLWWGWNTFCHNVLGLPEISIVEAFALFVLVSIVTGMMKKGG